MPTYLRAASFGWVSASEAEVLASSVFHRRVVPCHVALVVCHQEDETAWEAWVGDPHRGDLVEGLDQVEAVKCGKTITQ